jgi:hypothetical protein
VSSLFNRTLALLNELQVRNTDNADIIGVQCYHFHADNIDAKIAEFRVFIIDNAGAFNELKLKKARSKKKESV